MISLESFDGADYIRVFAQVWSEDNEFVANGRYSYGWRWSRCATQPLCCPVVTTDPLSAFTDHRRGISKRPQEN